MAKIDKSQYTKQEWKKIREQRRLEKQQQSSNETPVVSTPTKKIRQGTKIGFVLGNGTSRRPVNPEDLKPFGKIYGCNALYREFEPDYLVAVDVKMILEINKAGFQHTHDVWTNPNKSYQNIKNLNYFHPSKGWSSGPTALWLAAEHGYDRIYILGFDYKGLEDGKKLNNIYADTRNYKRSTDGATFFGNWMRQTKSVIQQHPEITFIRVIAPDNYIPEELNNFDNLKHIFVEDFIKMFQNS